MKLCIDDSLLCACEYEQRPSLLTQGISDHCQPLANVPEQDSDINSGLHYRVAEQLPGI